MRGARARRSYRQPRGGRGDNGNNMNLLESSTDSESSDFDDYHSNIQQLRENISINLMGNNNNSDDNKHNSDDTNNASQYDNNHNYPGREAMTQIMNSFANRQSIDPCFRSWQALYKHKEFNKHCKSKWKPFRNELEYILWLGRNNSSLGLTRAQIQFILDLVKTLQNNGHLSGDYKIPKSATTIEKYNRWFPKVPFCYV